MGLVMPAILQLLNLCVIGFALALQGSTGLNLSPSPEPLSVSPPIEVTPGPLPHSKSFTSNAPIPALQPNGSALHPAPAMPPHSSVPVPPEIKGQVPSLSPSTPTVLPPFGAAPPPLNIQGHVPSTPPTAPQGKPPVNKSPVSVPVAPVPVGTPSRNLPQISPAIHSSTPETSPLRAHQRNAPVPYSKSLTSNAPIPALQPNGSALHPAPAMPPHSSVPVPPEIKGQVPSLSPSTPTVLPPFGAAPPPLNIQGYVSSMPPTAPQGKPPVNKSPVSVPVAPVPVGTPSRNLPQISPAIHSRTPETSPLRAHQRNAPDNKVPTQEPITPVNTAVTVASPASKLPKNSPVVHPITPNVAPTILPVPVASPTRKLPQNSPSIHPAGPGESPSTLPDPEVSPVSSPPPSINWKRDHIPVVAPPYEAPKPSLPMGHSPSKAPSVHKPVVSSPSLSTNWKRDQMPVVAPPYEAPKPSIPMGNTPAKAPSAHKPVVSSPSPSTNRKKGRMPVVAPPYEAPKPSLPMGHAPAKAHSAHKPVVSSPSPSKNWKRGRMPVVAPPYEAPKPSLPMGHTPAKAPSVHKPVVPSPPPSIKWKRGQIPIAAPPYEAPKPSLPIGRTPAKAPSVHKPLRHYNLAPEPSNSSPEPPFNKGYHSPASSPPFSFYMHHHTRTKITNPAPAPSYVLSPSTSKQQGPVIPPASFRAGRKRNFAPPPLNPVPPSHLHVTPSVSHVSPAPSPSLKDASDYTRRSSSKSPKVPPLPPVQAFPPPPPNADCSSTICTEPYTNTPPGSPCVCVLPMQVGLRISVSLYTFFPLVSELAQEIAVGVFMEQSQVRIIGANAASQQPEKTVVLIDLVPLGEKFDYTTAFLTHQRFWHKKVVIKASYFGDYEVLYVRYPGLPPSPPSADADIMDEGPYPGNGNNARTIKPLGVDVHKGRQKSKLSGGIIAIITLSTFVAVALCSATAWILLFKPRDRASQPASTPHALQPSLGKASGTAGSIMESRHSSVSLSFGSSIAPYTGSAKTFTASDMERATDNFDPSRILGEGGFGLVYSGVLEDGTKVAVKVLKRDDQQGGREFLAEVEMLSRLHHRNLVKLIGICTEERSRCLVYELIPNGSVESHLHGIDKEAAPLSWGPRMKIALGSARGLAYLHEDSSPRVIHRDFKSSNILLEDDFTPKVSDFGLARTAMDEENRHISTRVMGTFGYVAPEYAMTGHLLVKSDVYSYGVVLLELLTGRKPVDMSQPPGEENLVAWARPLLTSKEWLEAIIDKSLGSDVPFESIAKVAAIASMCVQPEVSHRPFMGEVVQALKLVCNEFDEAKEIGSRSCSHEDLSIDMAAEEGSTLGWLPNPFQSQYSAPTYDSELESEREASMLKMFSTSMRVGRQESESFRRYSCSGPLGTGRSRQFWERLRRSSGGSVSEHGFMLKLWQGSH